MIYQAKTLSTALFSVTVLGKSFSCEQWVSFAILALGVILVQASSSEHAMRSIQLCPAWLCSLAPLRPRSKRTLRPRRPTRAPSSASAPASAPRLSPGSRGSTSSSCSRAAPPRSGRVLPSPAPLRALGFYVSMNFIAGAQRAARPLLDPSAALRHLARRPRPHSPPRLFPRIPRVHVGGGARPIRRWRVR